jgi:hypothetical protein
LTSAAIIAGLSLTTAASVAIVSNISDGTINTTEGFETMFVDSELLLKTLNEYDCCIDVISENEYLVKTNCGNIRYAREDATQAFKMYLDEIDNVEGLLENIKSFEVDYGRNVQSYTYNHIKENLSNGMTIVDEEILEDDSLYLTINVE